MTQGLMAAQDVPAPRALGLRLHGSVALVNSRDVAVAFGKQHAHVLRDIDALLAGAGGAGKSSEGGHPNLDGHTNQAVSAWFRPVLAWHEEAQRETRSFDLTTGRAPREQREAEFRAYQNKRRRLPGRQPTLFG